jgi:hypothetical protein
MENPRSFRRHVVASISFKHQDGKNVMVRVTGLQVCLDQGAVKEFYRPSEQQWIDPLKDPVRKRSGQSLSITFDNKRRNNYKLS